MNGPALAVCLLALLGFSYADEFNATKTLEQILEGYDKRFRPNWGGPPLEVGVTMYFIRIFDINTKERTVKTDYYFRHTWRDPRLAFNGPDSVQSITLGQDAPKMFWMPDTFTADGHAKFANENGMFFTRLEKDGTILSSVRVMTKASFPMDLEYFPFDKQAFTLSLESYGSGAKDIVYKWQKGNDSVGISEESGTPEFVVQGSNLKTTMLTLSMGTYSRLSLEIHVARQGGFYCRHFYIPATIAFILVWAAFWFHANYSTIRIILIAMSFGIGNYLLVQTKDHLPLVSYSTMLEKYITFHMIMSVVAVVECILVVYLYERSCKAVNDLGGELDASTKPENKEKVEEKGGMSSYISRSAQYMMTFRQHRRTYQKVDLLFRVLFPIIFIIYNIWYWNAFPDREFKHV